MSSCRCKEPENVINNVCERCLLPVCLVTPSKPAFREFWLDRWPLDGEFNDVKVLCKKPDAYDGKDAWWDFSGPHVIEYGAFEIADEFRISYKEKIAKLTQRNQELVEALEKSNRATTKTAEYFGAIEAGEYDKNRRAAPLRDYEVLIKDLCTEASLSGIQALSMDREK